PKETVRTDQGAEGADCRSRSSGCGPGGSSGLAEPVRPAGPQHRQDRAPGDGRTHRSGGGDRLGRGDPPPQRRGAEESGLLHSSDPGPGHGGRRQYGHDAAGQLRRDQPEGHGDVHSPGHYGECLLGYQEDQLCL
ncbi:Ribbon-helix-helix protein CopG domain-containing protein, partial [Dysosmobacter welbionis]